MMISVLLGLSGLAAQSVEVRGLVIDSASSQPIGGGEVYLIGGNGKRYIAATDEGGRFALAAPAGTYATHAVARGYILDVFSDDWKTVTLKSAAETVVVKMARRAVIAGRVVDERDQPVDGAEVSLAPAGNELPLTFLKWNVLGVQSIPTNDRGEFRIGVPPGRFA